jgi:Ca2+-binding EF-hand superfamily protein
MTSKYAKRFSVPEEFPPLLRSFTHDVLRDLPRELDLEDTEAVKRWIFAAGAAFFAAAPAEEAGGIPRLTAEELEATIIGMFRAADADESGFLDRGEFKALFQQLQATLHLSKRDVRRLWAEADLDHDGRIVYGEFVPLAVDIIQSIYATMETAAEADEREEKAVEESMSLLHGMPQEELEALMGECFRRADADGNGYLDHVEFKRCLEEADLGLTRREMNLLQLEVDQNEDGVISYEEFVPLCFNILVEIMAEEFKHAAIPKDVAELESFFLEVFAGQDKKGTGRMQPHILKSALRAADVGLTTVQINALMSEAEEDEEGNVDYRRFATTIATTVSHMIDFQLSPEAGAVLGDVRARDDADHVLGCTEEQMEAVLQRAFEELDAGRSGQLPRPEIRRAVTAALPDATAPQMNVIMALAEPEPNGLVVYSTVVSWSFKSLQWLVEQEMIADRI